ncbi:MAG: hypothetical protein IJ132_02910 [Firmicutes bacterium]|nr:hypothetical protein [Bacillota bacterium]
MKRMTILIIALVMILCTACNPLEEDAQLKIEDDVYDIYEMLRSEWKHAADEDAICDVLTRWAQDNEISASKLDYNNVAMSVDATDDYTKAPQTIIQCTIGMTHKKANAQCAAIAMAALKNTKEHGKIKVYFTTNPDRLTSKQIKTDNLISLEYCEETKLYTGSAESRKFTFSQPAKKVKTTGTVSYRVTITGMEGGPSSDTTRRHGNPLKGLGDLIKSCQSQSLAFQIAAFDGGTSAGTFPKSASMVITVDKNYEKKLLDRISAAEENFLEDYHDKDNQLEFISEKCKTPARSYSDETTSNIISFLYTIDEGVFAAREDEENDEDTDDDEIRTIANIGRITSNGNITIEIMARSIQPSSFSVMYDSYKNTADLSEFAVAEESNYPFWPFKESSDLTERYAVATRQVDLDMEPEWTFDETDCAAFYNKRQDMDMICIGANIQDGYDISTSLVLFLQSLNGEQ